MQLPCGTNNGFYFNCRRRRLALPGSQKLAAAVYRLRDAARSAAASGLTLAGLVWAKAWLG